MKPSEVKTTDCSCDDLIRTAERCGFKVKQGKKHCKVETPDGKFVTTIPRHNRIKRETAKGIARAFQQYGGKVIVK